ncbi:hypothetical protein PG997_008234 [Apiospora hydei]|uniref:Condensation domain-containing protein n=1 Tax=Apiospora hydei TaxID=1337664 RepID=A0ABR1WAA3_9PEZI
MLPAALFKRMKRVAAGAAVSATPFQFLLAAFRAFLYRHTREEDVVLLLVDNTRPHAAFDDVIGYFVSLVPLRCRGYCDGAFDALLGRVAAGVLDAMAHSRVPFEIIIDAVGADASNTRHFPVGQVVNYLPKSTAPKFSAKEFQIEEIKVTDMVGTCELAVDAMENADGSLGLKLEFDCSLYSAKHMVRFWDNLLVFLVQVIKDYQTPIADVKI